MPHQPSRMIAPAVAVTAAALSLAASAAMAGGDDDQVLWDIPYPSATFVGTEQSVVFDSPFARDEEVADDFQVNGVIHHVTARGRGCGSCGIPVVAGVHVRFYEWTPDGPGALQQESFVEPGPNFSWDGPGPYTAFIDLPTPFEADGWHYIAVQMAFGEGGGVWNLVQANRFDPINGAAQYRDNLDGGIWMDESDATSDISIQLRGEPTPVTPVVTAVSRTTVTGSDRIIVNGTNFGTPDNGTLLVGGNEAIVTAWSSTEIIGYVPEGVPAGPADLVIVNGGLAGDAFPITIVPREADGRIAWVFEGDASYTLFPPAIGADGTAYVDDIQGNLYALSADGALLWIADALQGEPGNGAEGPIAILDDGRIIVGTNPLGPTIGLAAFNPDGTHAWTLTFPIGLTWQAGPSIGPDGRIYGALNAAQLSGLDYDVFAVTPDGELAWTTAADPFILEDAAPGQEVAFGPSSPGGPVDQMIFTADRNGAGRNYAFDLEDGSQRFAVETAGGNDVGQTQLVADDDSGRFSMMEFSGLGGLGWGLQSFEPDGDRSWRFDPGIASGATKPSIDADGVFYLGWDLARLSAVSPSGSELWRVVSIGLTYARPRPNPVADELLVTAFENDAVQSLVEVRRTTDGSLHWSQTLRDDEGGDMTAGGRNAVITPDGTAAYVAGLQLPVTPDGVFRLVRLDLAPAPEPDPDVDGDGNVGFSDLIAVLAAFGPCGDPCPADVDGDGSVGFPDLLAVLGAWS